MTTLRATKTLIKRGVGTDGAPAAPADVERLLSLTAAHSDVRSSTRHGAGAHPTEAVGGPAARRARPEAEARGPTRRADRSADRRSGDDGASSNRAWVPLGSALGVRAREAAGLLDHGAQRRRTLGVVSAVMEVMSPSLTV